MLHTHNQAEREECTRACRLVRKSAVSTHTVQDALLGNGTACSGLSLPISDQPSVDSPSLRLSSQVLIDWVEWTTEAHQDPVPFHIPRDAHAPSSTVNSGDPGHCFHVRKSQRDGPSTQAARSQNSFIPLWKSTQSNYTLQECRIKSRTALQNKR